MQSCRDDILALANYIFCHSLFNLQQCSFIFPPIILKNIFLLRSLVTSILPNLLFSSYLTFTGIQWLTSSLPLVPNTWTFLPSSYPSHWLWPSKVTFSQYLLDSILAWDLLGCFYSIPWCKCNLQRVNHCLCLPRTKRIPRSWGFQ